MFSFYALCCLFFFDFPACKLRPSSREEISLCVCVDVCKVALTHPYPCLSLSLTYMLLLLLRLFYSLSFILPLSLSFFRFPNRHIKPTAYACNFHMCVLCRSPKHTYTHTFYALSKRHSFRFCCCFASMKSACAVKSSSILNISHVFLFLSLIPRSMGRNEIKSFDAARFGDLFVLGIIFPSTFRFSEALACDRIKILSLM